MDPPFAQTEADYFTSINYFFNRVKELAPDIPLMATPAQSTTGASFPIPTDKHQD